MIRLIGVTSLPTLFQFEGSYFATHGLEFDWPSSAYSGSRLSEKLSNLLPTILVQTTLTGYLPIDDGITFYIPLSRGLTIPIPSNLLTKHTSLRRRLSRSVQGERLLRYLHTLARNEYLQHALTHGIPNLNGNILASSLKMRHAGNGGSDLTRIINSAFQIRTITDSRKYLVSGWVPNETMVPEALHPNLLRTKHTLDSNFAEKDLTARFGFSFDIVNMAMSDFDTLFFNLLVNAVKYAKESSVISVDFLRKRNVYEVVFAMNSIGIDPDEAAKLCNLGFRGRRAIASATGGSGLGLTIAKTICEGYGGRLLIKPGKIQNDGFAENQFIVELPMAIITLCDTEFEMRAICSSSTISWT